MTRGSHDWLVFAYEEPTEIHHKGCAQTPESDHTGDAKAVVVVNSEQYAQEDEAFDVSCSCLDPLLGTGREKGVSA